MDLFVWTSNDDRNTAKDLAVVLTENGYSVRSVTLMNRATGKAMDKWGSPLVGPDAANYLILQPISPEDEDRFR